MKKFFLFLIFLISMFMTWGTPAMAAETQCIVTDMKWTSRNDGDPPFIRIVLDLSRSVKAEAAIDNAGKNFQVVLKNATKKENVAHQYDMDSRAIDFATLSENDRNIYLDIALTKTQKISDIRVFALGPDAKSKKPHRLVVDIPIIGAKRTYYKQVPQAKKSNSKPSMTAKTSTTGGTKNTSNKPVIIDVTTPVSNYVISDRAKKPFKARLFVSTRDMAEQIPVLSAI